MTHIPDESDLRAVEEAAGRNDVDTATSTSW